MHIPVDLSQSPSVSALDLNWVGYLVKTYGSMWDKTTSEDKKTVFTESEQLSVLCMYSVQFLQFQINVEIKNDLYLSEKVKKINVKC